MVAKTKEIKTGRIMPAIEKIVEVFKKENFTYDEGAACCVWMIACNIADIIEQRPELIGKIDEMAEMSKMAIVANAKMILNDKKN